MHQVTAGGVFLMGSEVRSDRGLSSGPADNAFEITPHDTDLLDFYPTRGLYVGGAGDAVVEFADGTEVTLTGLQAGVVYPFALRIVKDTDTTATLLIGLY
jgi:hypothetical protein